MQFVQWMQPRSEARAARSALVLALVGAISTAVLSPLQPGGGVVEAGLSVGVAIGIGLVGLGLRRARRVPPMAWVLAPVVGVVAIVALDFLTADSSVRGQIFLLFPALFAASELRRRGAAIVVALSVAGEAIVVFGQLGFAEALSDLGYVCAVLITVSTLLVLAAERQEALIERLRAQAAVDPLTGLVTRRVLDEAAHTALSGLADPATTGASRGTALVLLDVDRFKLINDRYGHPAGDAVLVQLADLLRGRCRSQDVVARLGGDEIAVLLNGCTSAGMMQRAEDFLRTVRQARFVLAHRSDPDTAVSISLTVSAGAGHAPTQAADLRGLYAVADEALYRAKHAGRNQVAGPIPA